MTLPNAIYSGKLRNLKATMKQEDPGNAYRLTLTFSQDSKYIDNACATKIEVFNGSNAVAITGSAVSQGGINGAVNFSWQITGTWNKIKIKHLSSTNGLCGLNPDTIINAPALSTQITGWPNGTHQLQIIPITTFFGEDYEGTPKDLQLSVLGSAQC
jgi:hypothetical protein